MNPKLITTPPNAVSSCGIEYLMRRVIAHPDESQFIHFKPHEELARARRHTVLLDKGVFVGCACLIDNTLCAMLVAPEARGGRLAGEMVAEVIREARLMKLGFLDAWVRCVAGKLNAPALRTLQAAGFRPVARRKIQWLGSPADAHLRPTLDADGRYEVLEMRLDLRH